MSHQWCPRQWLSFQAFCRTIARKLPTHASAGLDTTVSCSRTRRLCCPASDPCHLAQIDSDIGICLQDIGTLANPSAGERILKHWHMP